MPAKPRTQVAKLPPQANENAGSLLEPQQQTAGFPYPRVCSCRVSIISNTWSHHRRFIFHVYLSGLSDCESVVVNVTAPASFPRGIRLNEKLRQFVRRHSEMIRVAEISCHRYEIANQDEE
ncbi:hypothetical protein BaRGS_00020145 [Batillaria attramentaria]|uniref:Uncharacterized protein n=1 Tax=Batillaria attramentaria TaxID=370345 RepID=A0ABD0KNJ5_9CAEN